jgi:hypothetical protein
MGPSNQYEAAIYHVGSVLEPYDSDRMFPVFGYGGIPTHMGESSTNHCFPVNGEKTNPNVFGVEGIVGIYK